MVAKGAETCELAITTVELLRIRQPDFIQKGEVFEKGNVADLVRSHMIGLQPFKRTIEQTTETMHLAPKQ